MYLISVLLLSMLFVELHFLNLALDLGIAFKYAICWIAFLKYAIYLTRKYYQRDKLTVFLKFCHIFSSQNQMYPKSCREMFRMEEIFIAKRGKFSLKDFWMFCQTAGHSTLFRKSTESTTTVIGSFRAMILSALHCYFGTVLFSLSDILFYRV